MKLKHVFLSSLFLSATFVACTNDDFAESSAPVNTKGAIALGEGFSINVTKPGIANTRAEFNEKLQPVWEEGDQIGAAWYHMVTKIEDDKETVSPGGTSNIGSVYGGLYSNHPFTLSKGAGTTGATFTSPTNAFAGAYILYYNYDPTVSMKSDAIPVKVDAKQVMDCKTNTLAAVNDNMFSYGVAKFVPGGPKTGNFTLTQVPVLWKLAFRAKDQVLLGMIKDLSIEKVIVMATNAEGNYSAGKSVLVTEGSIKPGTTAPTVANYNDDELPAAVYAPEASSEVDHFTLSVENGNADYTIKELNTLTKPFYFSMLPFKADAKEVTIKVVAKNGMVFKTVYKESDEEGKKALAQVFNAEGGAVAENGQVVLNVTLDVTEQDDVIYTESQFKTKLEEAIASGKNATLKIGEDLELAEELVYSNAKNSVTVTVGSDNEKHSITVPSLDITKGNLKFASPLIVKGDAEISAHSKFEAEELAVEGKMSAEGVADIKAKAIKELNIATSGEVTLQGAVTTINNEGTLEISNAKLKTVNNSGQRGNITIGATVENNGTFTNAAAVTIAADFKNNGIFNQNGTLVANAKFENKAGATLNINLGTNSMQFENAAATANPKKAAAVINVAKDATLTAEASSVNKGKIVVNGTLAEAAANALTQNDADAVVEVSGTLTFTATHTAWTQGSIVMQSTDATVTGNAATEKISLVINKDSDISGALTGVTDLIINGNYTIKDGKADILKKYNLCLKGGTVTLEESMTMDSGKTVTVAGNVILTSADAQTLTLVGTTNEVLRGAKLTVAGKVTLADGSATIITHNNLEKTGENATVTITQKNEI